MVISFSGGFEIPLSCTSHSDFTKLLRVFFSYLALVFYSCFCIYKCLTRIVCLGGYPIK